MTTSQPSEATQNASPLAAPAGINLLGDESAGSCCGGSCAVPAE